MYVTILMCQFVFCSYFYFQKVTFKTRLRTHKSVNNNNTNQWSKKKANVKYRIHQANTYDYFSLLISICDNGPVYYLGKRKEENPHPQALTTARLFFHSDTNKMQIHSPEITRFHFKLKTKRNKFYSTDVVNT